MPLTQYLFLILALTQEAQGIEAKKRDPTVCRGVHTCRTPQSFRYTCPVYGYFYNIEQASAVLRKENCCKFYHNSYSLGFNLTGCGWSVVP